MPMQQSEVETDDDTQAPPPEANASTLKRQRVKRTDLYADATEQEKRELQIAKDGSVAKYMDRALNQSLKEWLAQLGDRPNVKVSVYRTKPDRYHGEKVDGLLHTYDYCVSDEEIKEQHGGGTFQIKVQAPDHRGMMRYAMQTVLDIAGNPKTESDEKAKNAPAAPSHDPMVQRAFDEAIDAKKRAEAEAAAARKQEGGGGQLQTLISTMQASHDAALLRADATNRELTRRLEDAMTKLHEAAIRPPVVDSFKEKMLDNLTTNSESRITALRVQHESEVRSIRENHQNEVRILNDRFDRDKEFLVRQHERQVVDMKASFEREISNYKAVNEATSIAVKSSNEVSSLILQRENDRLTKDNDTLRSEIKALQAKKEQSISEKAQELQAVKDVLGLGDGDKEDKPGWVQAMEVVGSLPQVGNFLNRFAEPSSQQAAPAQQTQQAAPVHQPRMVPKRVRDRRTAQVGVRLPNGQVAPLLHQNEDGTQEPVYDIDPKDIQQAVLALETACRNNIDPAAFVVGIRNMIPEPIVQAIRREGSVDAFLHKVAELDKASILHSQEGRNWLRRVSKEFLGE